MARLTGPQRRRRYNLNRKEEAAKPAPRAGRGQGNRMLRRSGTGSSRLASETTNPPKRFNNAAEINARLKIERAEKAARDLKQAQYLADKAAAKAEADRKVAEAKAKAEADKKARLAKQNSNTPSRAPAPTPSSAAQNLRAGRSPDRAPSRTAKKAYGSTGRKDLKQSSRMASALKNLKVRNYKKKK